MTVEDTGPPIDPRVGLRVAAAGDLRDARLQHRHVSTWLRERAGLAPLDEEPRT
jgi:hypothetical protein